MGQTIRLCRHMMNGEITIPPSSGLGKSVPPPGLFNLHKTHRQQQLKSFSPSIHLQSLWWLPRHPSWLSCLLQCQVLTTFHSPLLSPPNKEGSFVVSRNGLVIFNVVRLALSQKKKIREGLRHGIAPIPISTFFPPHGGAGLTTGPGTLGNVILT